ncbi:MAG: DNA repair protein RadA [Actinomycetia bacterium]|nr:DNA repair protein RadA [Actinomycetes bacterium]MCP5030863.1 DNA repair protein RadA [Actinomycetes bacterium]
MARSRRFHVCTNCGAQHPGWTGQCPSCQAWATVEEVARPPSKSGPPVGGGMPPVQALAELSSELALPSPTGVDEIDRVLGGGLVPGGVTLIGGEPGVGKSTLTLQLAMAVATHGAGVLVVAGEEAPSQIAARADRLGTIPPSLLAIDDTSVAAIVGAIEDTKPQVAIIDSIQTVSDEDLDGAPGSVVQLKAVTERLVQTAKRTGVSMILIGHLTKEGSLAGPKVIEHMVDTVLSFGGDAAGQLRFLRAAKHRFGPTSEVGIFEMSGTGLTEVADPSRRFLTDRQPGIPGSVVVASLDGRRPVMVELQALIVEANGGGAVSSQGVESRRVALVAAVLACRASLPILGHDVFVSAAGGAKMTEPGGDLGLALALASAITDHPVAPEVVAVAEIGLGGELRSVPQLELRLQEAYRLGFRTALVPESAPEGPTGMKLIRSTCLHRALEQAIRYGPGQGPWRQPRAA